MSTKFDSASLTEAARAIVYAYYFDTRKQLDATAEHLRRLLGWDSFGDPARDDIDCCCKGWDVFNEDPDTGYLGEIQACDLCRPDLGDDAAAELASSKG